MSNAWPPPPDLASIRELVRASDIEGHIAEGAPSDEYEPEEESIFASIAHLSTSEITAPILNPILEQVWRDSFALDDDSLAQRRPALHELARQIARFFGPEAQPQVRGSNT
jgi:hypothetical protein